MILQKYVTNAYGIDLSPTLHINPMFNVANLHQYPAPNGFQFHLNLGTSNFEKGVIMMCLAFPSIRYS